MSAVRICERCGSLHQGKYDQCRRCRQTPSDAPRNAEELIGGEWVLEGAKRVYKRVALPTTSTVFTPRNYCGTDAGYQRHRRLNEDPCHRCLYAHAAKARTKKPPKPPREPASHGTNAAWKQHTIAREKPCYDCLEAHRQYQREYMRAFRAKRRAKAVDSPVDTVDTRSRMSRSTGRIRTSPESAPTPIRGLTHTNRSDRSEGSMESIYSHPQAAISSEVA